MAGPSDPEASDVYGKEEAMAKILVELSRTESPKLLSDIDEEEIPILIGLGRLKDKLNSDLLGSCIKEFLEYRVSLHRQGRQEMITVALASRYQSGSGKSKSGLKSLLSGLR